MWTIRCTALLPRPLRAAISPRDSGPEAPWKAASTRNPRAMAPTKSGSSPGRAAGVFTTHPGSAHKLAHRLRAGTVWVNMYHAIDPAVPFGGVRMSGHGCEGGTEHLDEFLDTKAIWINTD